MLDHVGADKGRTFLPFDSLSWFHFNVKGAKAREEGWGMPLNPLEASQVGNGQGQHLVELGLLTIM